jgi:hypothetical protein
MRERERGGRGRGRGKRESEREEDERTGTRGSIFVYMNVCTNTHSRTQRMVAHEIESREKCRQRFLERLKDRCTHMNLRIESAVDDSVARHERDDMYHAFRPVTAVYR